MRGIAHLGTCLLCAALACAAACGDKPPAPPAHAPAPAAAATTEDQPAASHDPFEQPDDLPLDPERALEELRHDCCSELPPAELEKHTQPPRP